MSKTVGSFVRVFARASGDVLYPLPIREAGQLVGAGPAAGHAVRRDDWACLLASIADRAPPGPASGLSFDVYPHAVCYAYSDSSAQEADAHIWAHPYYVTRYFLSAIAGTGSYYAVGVFLDPEWPWLLGEQSPTVVRVDGRWDSSDYSSGRYLHRFKSSLRDKTGNTPGGYYQELSDFARRFNYPQNNRTDRLVADDVRSLFYDVSRMARRLCVVAASYYDSGGGEITYYQYKQSSWERQAGGQVLSSGPSSVRLGQNLLNIRSGVSVSRWGGGGGGLRGFVVVLFSGICRHYRRDGDSWILTSAEDEVNAYAAVPVGLGSGDVTVSDVWDPAALGNWVRKAYYGSADAVPPEGDELSASASVWNPSDSEKAYVYLDLSFPLDSALFTGWNWTPS